MLRLTELLFAFIRIGAFTFGGGYAMIPLIEKEIVEKRRWINEEDILEIVAIAESTPGSIAVNAATFVGFHIAGIMGALFATIGVIIPSFIIIIAIALLLQEFAGLAVVANAFFGIRAAVLILLLTTLYRLFTRFPRNRKTILLTAASFVMAALFKLSVFYVIIICALIGLAGYREEEL